MDTSDIVLIGTTIFLGGIALIVPYLSEGRWCINLKKGGVNV